MGKSLEALSRLAFTKSENASNEKSESLKGCRVTTQFSDFQLDQIKRFARVSEYIKNDAVLRFGPRSTLNRTLASEMKNDKLPEPLPGRLATVTEVFEKLSDYSITTRTITALTLIGLAVGSIVAIYAWRTQGRF